MADPIINPAAAASAYAGTAKVGSIPSLDGGETAGRASFGDFLKNSVMEGIKTMRGGEAASARAVAGDASLPEVVQAVTAAELTLQTVVAIRDRLVSAYQDLMRMPI